jgi:hypothetical protein
MTLPRSFSNFDSLDTAVGVRRLVAASVVCDSAEDRGKARLNFTEISLFGKIRTSVAYTSRLNTVTITPIMVNASNMPSAT